MDCGSQILNRGEKAGNIKINICKSSIFWNIWSCSLVKVNRRFGEVYRIPIQDRRVSQTRYHHETGSKQSYLSAWFILVSCFVYTSSFCFVPPSCWFLVWLNLRCIDIKHIKDMGTANTPIVQYNWYNQQCPTHVQYSCNESAATVIAFQRIPFFSSLIALFQAAFWNHEKLSASLNFVPAACPWLMGLHCLFCLLDKDDQFSVHTRKFCVCEICISLYIHSHKGLYTTYKMSSKNRQSCGCWRNVPSFKKSEIHFIFYVSRQQ
jgi:hypothetical protein